MIALILATALLFDVTPRREVALSVQQPKAETVLDTSAAQVPTSVAVTLECTAHANGRVGECAVLGETHPGLGFAEAAIALMTGERVAPGSRDVQFARTIQFTP